MSDSEEKTKNKEEKPKFVVRSATDVQRIKLKKLMENPQKEVIIPTVTKKNDEFSMSSTPSFVRNVMGSSAGAGSGEFHVYRHLRRKEYARQKQIQQKSRQEELDDEFQRKLEQNRLEAEMKTSKKRAKRLKKKQKAKNRRIAGKGEQQNESNTNDDETESDSNDEENDDINKDEKKPDERSESESGSKPNDECTSHLDKSTTGKDEATSDADNS